VLTTPEGDIFDWIFLTNNTFELGVEEDDKGNLIFDPNTPRIDSANGLYKLKLANSNNKNLNLNSTEDYLNKIEKLREIILKTANK
jgi:hypothetical protein